MEIRQGNLQLLVGLISLSFDKRSLGLTSLCDSIDFLGLDVSFLVLLVELFVQLVSCLSGDVKLGTLFLKDELHGLYILSGLGQLVETLVNVLLFLVDGLILAVIQLMVSLDEGEIGLGGDIDVSTHLLEVLLADRIDHLVDLAHVDGELLLCGGGCIDFDIREEFGGHGDQRLLGPWQEPIDGGTREHSRELLGTLSELCINRGEGKNHMEIVLDSVEEVLPQN